MTREVHDLILASRDWKRASVKLSTDGWIIEQQQTLIKELNFILEQTEDSIVVSETVVFLVKTHHRYARRHGYGFN